MILGGGYYASVPQQDHNSDKPSYDDSPRNLPWGTGETKRNYSGHKFREYIGHFLTNGATWVVAGASPEWAI